MQYVEGILYHRIMDSDFTNMYAVKKPTTGGGQTYIQAAGYSRQDLETMFMDSDIVTNTAEYWDDAGKYPKKNFKFIAHVIGSNEAQEIELAPRTSRKDYRVCRQNPKHRHPAWSEKNAFPQPLKAPDGSYKYVKNYPGIIDNLTILIIKTVDDANLVKYYAWFINAEEMPASWPTGIGLESLFMKSKSQGILLFDDHNVRFKEDIESPLSAGSLIDKEVDYIELPTNINEIPTDVVELSENKIDFGIDIEHIAVSKDVAPQKRTSRKKGRKAGNSSNIHKRNYDRMREAGAVGELIALKYEKDRLIKAGRADLAKKIQHTSKRSDDEGYDIQSFTITDSGVNPRYIEVKTTTGAKSKPFDISANEISKSIEYGENYYIYRFYGLSKGITSISYYEVNGPIPDNFSLTPTSYSATCK